MAAIDAFVDRPLCLRSGQRSRKVSKPLVTHPPANHRHREDSANENLRLRRRIAELESVVRGLKNSPHPRWASTGVPTEELPKMYRRRTRDNTAEAEPVSPTTDCSANSQDSSYMENFVAPSSSSASSDGAITPTSNESTFIPAAPQQSLALPTDPSIPPPDLSSPFDLSFFLDPTVFGSFSAPQAYPSSSWSWNR